MRLYCFSFLFFLVSHPNLKSQTDNENAIIQVVENETKAFCKNSLADVVKTYWILDEKTIKYVTHPDGFHKVSNAADMLSETEAPPESHATFANSDYHIGIKGNMAFLTYTQVATLDDGAKVHSHEMRILENVDGKWKIHNASIHLFTPPG
jgi:ketosteroid isomerase-like protein